MNTEDYELSKVIFRNLCEKHDLNYHYSDNSVKYQRGAKSFKELMLFAENLLEKDKIRIYNEVVDAKITEEFRSEYYLKTGVIKKCNVVE